MSRLGTTCPAQLLDDEVHGVGDRRRQPELAIQVREECQTSPGRHALRWNWAASAAAAWALLFALQSLAAAILVTSGSAFAADTFAADFARLARERNVGFIAVLWAAVVAKTLLGMLALAPTRSWARRVPRRPLTIATSATGALVLLYGVANLIQTVLMKTGVAAVPDSLGAKALSWHLWLWDPYWILGGVLFLIAAHAGSRPRARSHGHGRTNAGRLGHAARR